jgi:dienelactone hydrolase
MYETYDYNAEYFAKVAKLATEASHAWSNASRVLGAGHQDTAQLFAQDAQSAQKELLKFMASKFAIHMVAALRNS